MSPILTLRRSEEADDEARRHTCFRVQLTRNKARTRAHRFYEGLGFKATHEEMKLALT